MPNYTKKHRTFIKKIGGAHHQRAYTNWVARPGNSYAVDLERFQRPRQPQLDPETSIADAFKRFYGINISNSSIISALRLLSSRLFSRTSNPATIVETPPSAPIVETPQSATIVETSPPPARPSNNTASKTRNKPSPSIKKQTLRRSRRSRR